jgi:hypothetical protein
MTLFVRDRGAAGPGEVENFAALKPRFLTPAPEVGSTKIECVSKLDEHVERHHQTEGVFAPLVVDDVLDGDERAVFRQRAYADLIKCCFSQDSSCAKSSPS